MQAASSLRARQCSLDGALEHKLRRHLNPMAPLQNSQVPELSDFGYCRSRSIWPLVRRQSCHNSSRPKPVATAPKP